MVQSPANRRQQRYHSACQFREPAAPSLTPRLLQWEPAPPHLHALLQAAYAGHCNYYSAASARDGAISYCRITDADRNADLFIKIMPKRLATALQRSATIADYVRSRGVLTPTCLPEFPKSCSDGRVIFAYPFVEGHYLNGTQEQLKALGIALADLHKVLSIFPDGPQIVRRRNEMRSRMRYKAKELLADQRWASGDLSQVRSHVRHWLDTDTMLGKNPCQVIHNDLNAGNILQDALGNIWFLDFEEARWSYLPPHFDLAKVIERFILVNETRDMRSKIDATRLFLKEYGLACGNHCNLQHSIPDALRWLLGFSWLRMSRLLYEPEAAGHPEVCKFIQVAEILEDNQTWLATL